eukprot:10846-Heterococcus_DN1.PRE.2
MSTNTGFIAGSLSYAGRLRCKCTADLNCRNYKLIGIRSQRMQMKAGAEPQSSRTELSPVSKGSDRSSSPLSSTVLVGELAALDLCAVECDHCHRVQNARTATQASGTTAATYVRLRCTIRRSNEDNPAARRKSRGAQSPVWTL